MVEEPLEAPPVATPVPASMVTKPLFDDQAPPASPSLVTETTDVGLMACVPLNVPALGAETSVNDPVAIF